MSDDILFIDEKQDENELHSKKETWKVIIADDEPEIHTITKMVLSDIKFENKTISFVSAYSGEETKKVVADNPDAAIILLDVVMETDTSGLDVVKYIRDVLKNNFIRIILRTGQPGHAPERDVITEYDINDYKEKTELTSQKLYTTITSSLRAYRDIYTIEKSKNGLKNIITASSNLFSIDKTPQKFIEAVLEQLASLLKIDSTFLYLSISGFAAVNINNSYEIISGTDYYKSYVHRTIDEVDDKELNNKIRKVINEKESVFLENEYIGYFRSKKGSETILYIKENYKLTELDMNLLKIFSTNVTIALDNMALNQEIINTQKEILINIGEVVETRSKETANHVKRVAQYSSLIAEKIGMAEDEVELLRHASPMHDLGKIGIPDIILNKPGQLTPEEFEIIKTHSVIGYDILNNSERKILRTAAIISLEHHERWDGKGYPKGLKEKEINIFGRITAVADVFDALSQKRVYRDAWPIDKVISFIKENSGTQFDPEIVGILIDNMDKILEIMEKNPGKK